MNYFGPKGPRCRAGILLVLGAAVLSSCAWAQYEENPVPLGDVARSVRKKKDQPAPAPSKAVIDNDNLTQVMDDAESHRVPLNSPLYSFGGAAKTFQISTPDVTCSLSFNGQASSLLARPHVPIDLPEEELRKLDGPAVIDEQGLQVSVFNGTEWKIEEITVGLTIVQRSSTQTARRRHGLGRLVPASEQSTMLSEKRADVTTIHRLKGEAAPAATTVFKAPINLHLGPDQEWHWAIIQAKGEPPVQLPSLTNP